MKRLLYTLVLFTSAVTMRFSSIAQALDNSFGTGGIVTTNVGFGPTNDEVKAMALQPDGKIIVAGISGSSLSTKVVVMRHLTDGTPDVGFGNNGVVLENVHDEDLIVSDILLQPDGKILVSGSVYQPGVLTFVFVLRFLSNGTLDSGFGDAGIAKSYFSFQITNSAIGLRSDNKIIVGVTEFSNGSSVFRLTESGFIDETFGEPTATINQYRFYIGDLVVRDIAIRLDNKILIAGSTRLVSPAQAQLLQVLADGSGVDGSPFKTGSTASFYSVALQSDEKIVVGGNVGSQYVIARLNSGGTLDNSFGNNGIVLNEFGGSPTDANRITSIAIQSDGKVVVAGFRLGSVLDYNFSAARHFSNGLIDPCFGTSGKLEVDFSGANAQCNSVAVQSDGNIIMAGWVLVGSDDRDLALARYASSQPITWYLDADNDGFGDDNNTVVSCTDPSTNPVICPLIDDPSCDPTNPPCNQIPDPFCTPTNGVKYVSQGGDCNDSDAAIKPGATEVCDGKDNNCDGQTDEGVGPQTWYLDADGDGYGDDNTTQVSCIQPSGQVVKADPLCIDNPTIPFMCPTKVILWVATGGDCNDNDAAVKPGATEVCDGKDNDCDGQTDEGLPTTTYYIDADGDGYGTGTGIEYCSNPGVGYTSQSGDCNDSDASIHPTTNGTVELCDGIDNDCDGVIDEGCSGKPTLSISDVTVYESEGKAVLTIKLSHITTLQVKVAYSTADGTAVSNKKEKDYKSIGSTMLTIPPGTLSTTITVPVYNDGKAENNEYFYVNLSKPTNCLLGDVSGMVTILDGTPITSARNSMAAPIQNEIREQTEISLQAKAFPNPSSTSFTVQVDGGDGTPVDMRIFNSMGQVVKALRSADRTLRFGDELQKGIYILEVRQGSNRKTIKLIKQ